MRRYLDLIFLRAFAEVKSSTHHSYLGAVWWFLDPLLYLVVFYLVFDLFLQRGGEGFVSYLLIGLVFWRWFETIVQQCSQSMISYKAILEQVYLPKWILPFISFTSATIKFFIVLFVLILFLIILDDPSYSTWVWLPLVLVVQALVMFGLGVLLSALIPFFPDLRGLIGYGISLLFFMSAIFYRIDDLPPETHFLFMLNPMAFFIECHRGILIYGNRPDLLFLVGYVTVAAFLLMVGFYLLHRYDRVYPKIIG
jgi:lipopolysaccharide transport system permease protein